MRDVADDTRAWAARPRRAALIRAVVLLAPIGASLLFVNVASRVVRPPVSSFWLYLGWWVLLTAAATAVLVAVDKLSRRLLPLAALFKLSLVFPDRAPSRFRTAMRTGTAASLEERLAAARAGRDEATPVEAAERLLGLVAALDLHDRLTRGHSDRVRAYAQLIAEEMRLSKAEIDHLNWAALLHDVGKLEVPREILAKEGRPTEAEWAVLRRHPQLGRKLVAPLEPWLGEWLEAVSQHHERWDGKGYPAGAVGEQIALAGRIVAVADVFDVITSARSYKRAWGAVDGRAEIARCAGAQFDPGVVRAFLNVSLGRLRFAMGPLSWLAHAPILGRLPLTPAVGTLSATAAAVAAAVSTGIVGSPAIPPAQAANATSAVLGVARAVDEDEELVVRLPATTGGRGLLSLRIVTPPSAGSAAIEGDAIRYTPPRDYHGVAGIVVEGCRDGGACTRAILRVVVRPVNDPPVAVDDAIRSAEDAPVVVDVLENDSDPDGDPLTAAKATDATVGSVSIIDGRAHLILPRDFNGKAAFSYMVRDSHRDSAEGHVTVLVAATNDRPRPAPDISRTSVGAAIRVLVLDNDVDPDGDTLWVLRVGAPTVGRIDNDGSAVTFVPPPRFVGTASFTYTVSDRFGAVARARVDVAVGNVNLSPVAVADEATVVAGRSVLVDVLANDSDPEHEGVSLAAVGSPSIGKAVREGERIRYTAPESARGATKFPYRITDPLHATDTGTVTVRISEPPHPPEPAMPPDRPTKSSSPPVPAQPTPPGAPPVVPAPAPTVPPPAAPPPSVPPPAANTAPSFVVGPDQTVVEDAGPQSRPGWATAISAGPPADAGQTVSFTVTTTNATLFTAGGQPALAANGTLTFTPALDANGAATVTLRAIDNGGTANGGVDTSPAQVLAIMVTSAPDAPAAVDDAASVNEDDTVGVTFQVLANDADADGDALSLASFDGSSIANGTLTHNGAGNFRYIPDPGYAGSETFSYTTSDGNGGTDTATATLTIAAQPDAPEAAGDAYTTPQDTALMIAAPGILGNDADEDGDTLTVQAIPIAPPTSGTVALGSDGAFTYTPNAGFAGTDTFAYRIADGTGLTGDAFVTITVSTTITLSNLYFTDTGPLSLVWGMSPTPPGPASPVPDHDADGAPGLSVKSSNGNETETDTRKFKAWAYTTIAPLVLNGPVTLRLWSTIASFEPDNEGHPYVYLYDCAAGGILCVKIAENDVHASNWNGNVSDWVYRAITVGSVSRTIGPGRQLKVVLLFKHSDLWLAMTGAYPSGLTLTLGP